MLRVSDFIQKSSNCVIHLFVFLAYTLHFIILYSLIIDSVAIHWLLFRLRECVSYVLCCRCCRVADKRIRADECVLGPVIRHPADFYTLFTHSLYNISSLVGELLQAYMLML